MRRFILTLIGLWIFLSQSQNSMFYALERESLQSLATGYEFEIDISLPMSWAYKSEKVGFPLIILFDSHNEATHQHNINSIDILTLHGQIPESVVVGIPFSQQNRYYLTSSTKLQGDTLSGLQKMALFLFDELIPFLNTNYKTGDPVILIGHSRTGYLTSYLMLEHVEKFHMAGSFSGFMDDRFNEQLIRSFADEYKGNPKPFHYYFSAGEGSLQEKVYYDDLDKVSRLLTHVSLHENFYWSFFGHPFAGHMANYNFSVPAALTRFFGDYSQILDQWLFEILPDSIPENTTELLFSDFENFSQRNGYSLYPQSEHFISIGSHLLNQPDQLKRAADLFRKGLELYPNDYYMNYLYCITQAKSDNFPEALSITWQMLELLQSDTFIPVEEKTNWIEEFTAIKEALEE